MANRTIQLWDDGLNHIQATDSGVQVGDKYLVTHTGWVKTGVHTPHMGISNILPPYVGMAFGVEGQCNICGGHIKTGRLIVSFNSDTLVMHQECLQQHVVENENYQPEPAVEKLDPETIREQIIQENLEALNQLNDAGHEQYVDESCSPDESHPEPV